MGRIAILRRSKGAAELVVVSADDEADNSAHRRSRARQFGLRASQLDSQSAIGYRTMVWSALFRIVGTLTRLTRCHVEQEKT
jgi:hypothetical protein